MMIIRAISGLGLGCLMPATFSLLGDHFPQSKRGRALGVIGLVGLMGTVIWRIPVRVYRDQGFVAMGLYRPGHRQYADRAYSSGCWSKSCPGARQNLN